MPVLAMMHGMPSSSRKNKKPEVSEAPAGSAFAFQLPGTDPAAAQNIWLAGLGALASAQAEGSKAFDALVKQGLDMQAQTKEQWSEAAQRLGSLNPLAGSTGSAADPAPWDRLGGIFENRVARALGSLGMPSAAEVAALQQRVAALEQALAELRQTLQPAATSPARKSRAQGG